MINTKRMARCGSSLLVALGLGLSLSAGAETLRFGGNFSVEHSSSRAMEVFASELAKSSSGDLKAQLFPAMQLGGAMENIDQVRSGAVMGTWVGISYLSRTVPELESVSLPFAFASRQQAFDVMDGKVGDILNQKLAEKGFVALGYMELGFRHVTNSTHAINSLEDFGGLKLRLQPNQTHLATMRAVGANPVSMGIKEVYGALQQGVLDGQENPYSIISTKRFDEVQTYLSDTGHFYDFIVVAANLKKFNKLSADEQQAVRAAMAKAVAWQRAKAAEEDTQARDELIKRGMVFTPISDALRAQLKASSQGVVEDLKAKIGDEVINAVMLELDK
ncbi:MAG: TRAP transporter substrate-binding protein [Motiliproteus sp.]